MKKNSIRIGIITALEKEFAAMKALLQNGMDYFPDNSKGEDRYYVGFIPSAYEGSHQVVLAMADIGNNMASIRASKLLQAFRSVIHIIMTGIAGGVPYPTKPEDHVRLGDIVISDRMGVIQYDFDKESADRITPRPSPRPPSSWLLKSVRHLKSLEYEDNRPWLRYIDDAILALVNSREAPSRPPEEEDVLVDTEDAKILIVHPIDKLRRIGEPRVHYGPIASANKLLKNPVYRDKLRGQFGVKAVEMESSGIADATWESDRAGYMVVRGICDYCDSNKNDRWQMYASVAAAAYTRALIESLPAPKTKKTIVLPIQVQPDAVPPIKNKKIILNYSPDSEERTRDMLLSLLSKTGFEVSLADRSEKLRTLDFSSKDSFLLFVVTDTWLDTVWPLLKRLAGGIEVFASNRFHWFLINRAESWSCPEPLDFLFDPNYISDEQIEDQINEVIQRMKVEIPTTVAKLDLFYRLLEEELRMGENSYFGMTGARPETNKSFTQQYFAEQARWMSHQYRIFEGKVVGKKKLPTDVADELIEGFDIVSAQLEQLENLLNMALRVKHDHPSALTMVRALSQARDSLHATKRQVWKSRGEKIDHQMTDEMLAMGRQIEFLRGLLVNFSRQTPPLLMIPPVSL